MGFLPNNGRRAAAQRVLVIGAGVSGLTSALCLRRHGFDVTVIADRFAPRVTSVVAGALWEWPPAVCGHHHDQISLARAKAWCMTSYEVFAELARSRDRRLSAAGDVLLQAADRPGPPAAGQDGRTPGQGAAVPARPHPDCGKQRKSPRWRSGCVLSPGADDRHGRVHALAARRNRASRLPNARAKDRWPAARGGRDAGARIRSRRHYPLHRSGARELADDAVYPVRGALIRVRNDGRAMPRITQAHCISHHGSGDERGFVFIVPRGDDMLILGGFAEPDEWQLDIGLDNHEPVRTIYRQCVEFMPVLKGAEIDAAEPVRVGLRPFRHAGVRVEAEPGTRIVHNYGHGGSGVTFSWGCAGSGDARRGIACGGAPARHGRGPCSPRGSPMKLTAVESRFLMLQ